MKRTIIRLAVIAIGCSCALSSLGQEDSSRLDVGYLTLNKSLTPVLSIKGEDLEKMPFANLSDAIAAWLYGAYTQPANLLYVVDGSPAADVNAYSVFDIEEVILVENAAAMVYTAAGQQEVVLIRTRRGKGKAGMVAAAQAGLVNGAGLVSGGINGLATDTRWYHQYYLGANLNPGAWRFGASVGWLRDVQPIPGLHQIIVPDNLQRWRLHGYADWQPDKHDQLELAVGYAPEKFRIETDSAEQQDFTARVRNSATQRFFLPELRWHGEWLGGLTNQLQASYIQSVYQETSLTAFQSDTSNEYYDSVSAAGDRSSYHVYLSDRLAYSLASGGWRIEPAVSASYEHFNERLSTVQQASELDGPGSQFYYSNGGDDIDGKTHYFFFTPQLDIHYKKGFDLTGGEMIQGVNEEIPGSHKAFFFVSGLFDVLRLGNENSSCGLAFFGSYAQRVIPPLPGYQLADLNYGYWNENPVGVDDYTAYLGNQFIYNQSSYPPHRLWVWEAGFRYTGWKDRLQIQGNIERQNYAMELYEYIATVGNSTSLAGYPEMATDLLLHLDVRVRVLEGNEMAWQSGINATLLKSKLNSGASTVQQDEGLSGYTGDIYPDPYSVTGGWVNRVRVRHFIGGVDLLYHFGETYFETGPGAYPVVTRKLSSVAVPNIYDGYTWKVKGVGVLEFFAESSWAIRSMPNDLTDGRRYYTIGGKLTI